VSSQTGFQKILTIFCVKAIKQSAQVFLRVRHKVGRTCTSRVPEALHVRASDANGRRPCPGMASR